MPKVGCIDPRDDTLLYVIKCVHEMQEVSRVMELASFTCDNKEFIMVGINISPAESTALFEFLSYIKNLNKLVIRKCYMEHFAFRELAKSLIRDNDINCKLTRLAINNSILTGECVKYLSDALKSGNCNLTELNIRSSKLTDEDAQYLSDALESDNCKLTQLDISGNKLTYEGAKYLSDALKSGNCKLTQLDITHNQLTYEGAKYLSDALESGNCKLTQLDIKFNKLTDEGDKYLRIAKSKMSDNRKLILKY